MDRKGSGQNQDGGARPITPTSFPTASSWVSNVRGHRKADAARPWGSPQGARDPTDVNTQGRVSDESPEGAQHRRQTSPDRVLGNDTPWEQVTGACFGNETLPEMTDFFPQKGFAGVVMTSRWVFLPRPSEGGVALHVPRSHTDDPGLIPTEGSRQATATSPTWAWVWGSITEPHVDPQGDGQAGRGPRGDVRGVCFSPARPGGAARLPSATHRLKSIVAN